MRIVNKLVNHRIEGNVIILNTDAIDFKVMFLRDEIVRIRAGFDNEFIEESYSLVMTGWNDRLDHVVVNDRKKVDLCEFDVIENEQYIMFVGKKLQIKVMKAIFQIFIYDMKENQLHADIVDLAYYEDSNARRIHTSEILEDDHFYGFGEKSGEFNKHLKFMTMNPGDTMGYNPKESDSLYKHIPFYVKANKNSKIASGYFYHTAAECDFDMGREHSNYWKKHSRFRVNSGDVDLFFIAGPSIAEVIERYTDLTGKSVRLPGYALGYLGSSMYYSELAKDCDQKIVEFIDDAKAEGIPIDGFQLSSGYTTLNNKRYVFEWNEERFRDPKAFFANMKVRGIGTSPNVKPGLLLTHPKLEELKKEAVFVKTSDKSDFAVGNWWGGKGLFIDFTNPHARAVWKNQLTKYVLDYGVDSIWNDNCEYESIIDRDAQCDYDGKGGKIGDLKPVMANIMCQITIEAVNERFENVRPFVVCRAGHAGIQRFAQSWSGDNYTSWDSLKYNISTILGMAISGVTNYGADIGGFYGDAPEEELFVRWVQNGIFQPRFSIHSTNSDNTVTEPWMYSNSKHLIRDAILFRYQMFPMYYSLMVRASKKGLPILQPMVMAFQEDENCYENGIDFVVGNSLLVANVVEKSQSYREVYLPRGNRYYDFYRRQRFEGGQTIKYPVTLSTIPLFIIGGSITLLSNTQIHNLHQERVTDLRIIIAPDKDTEFVRYEDDGLSNDYQNGAELEETIQVKTGEITSVAFSKKGNYKSSVTNMMLDVIHSDRAPYWVSIDGTRINNIQNRNKFESVKEGWYYSQTTRSVLVKYKNIDKDYIVNISFENFDMIGM